MASYKQHLLQRFGALERREAWEQLAALATNAAIIVVIAFIIAFICVGGT